MAIGGKGLGIGTETVFAGDFSRAFEAFDHREPDADGLYRYEVPESEEEELERLREENQRLRAALVEERATAEYYREQPETATHWPGAKPEKCDHYLANARRQLRAEGLLPPE